ncbi:MAG: hypothetical protein P8X74_16515, partial [Reinekea sp.]
MLFVIRYSASTLTSADREYGRKTKLFRHKKRPPKRPFSCNHFMAHLRRQITLLDDLRYNARTYCTAT